MYLPIRCTSAWRGNIVVHLTHQHAPQVIAQARVQPAGPRFGEAEADIPLWSEVGEGDGEGSELREVRGGGERGTGAQRFFRGPMTMLKDMNHSLLPAFDL